MTLSNDHIIVWVTRPERPKGVKDEVKPKGRQLEVGAQRAPKLLVTLYFSDLSQSVQ